jgi:hypothetical protein
VPLVATIRLPKQYDDLEIYEAAGKQYGSWMQQADSYYRRLRGDRLQIITGDPEIDKALAWATVALDQAEGCNLTLDVGCSRGMVQPGILDARNTPDSSPGMRWSLPGLWKRKALTTKRCVR